MKKYIRILGKILPAFVLASIISVNLNAQTGPGGVGNSDGSNGQPEVLFWLSADSLGLSDTDPVTLWNDLSGNGRDFSQITVTNQPTFLSSGINSIPTVSFDGTDDFLEDDDAENYINGLSGISVIAVVQSNETASDAGFFDTEDPDGNDDLLTIRYDDAGGSGGGNDVMKMGLNTSLSSTSMESSALIQSTSPQMFTLQWNSGGALNLYADGSLDTPTSPSGNLAGTIQNTTKAIIGRGPKDAANGWNGYVSEMILVGENLSEARRNIIENYLSEKYNIAISNDLLTSLDAAYNHNIAGIGEEADGQHTTASSGGIYLTALSGLGVGDYVFTSHNNLTNNSSNFRTGGEVTAAGAIEAYNRTWYIERVNTPTARIGFDFSEALEDGLYPTNYTNYVLLYRSGTSGNFSKVKNADGIENGNQVYFDLNDTQLQTGYYTLATEDDANSPLEGIPGRTWYTLISGDWDNWEIWTLDPSGSLPNNPGHYTPSTSPTRNADNVVIKTGRTVTVSSDSLVNASLVIEGRLDLQTTTGHDFGKIRGTGRVLLAADNFPTGDASHFYTKGQGEGTVEYYGGSYPLTTAREFYNVEIELSNSANILEMAADYTINGNLYVTNGIFQINDASNTNPLLIDVAGDVLVDKETALSTEGKITVGAVDAYDSGAQTGYGNYHKGFHVFRIGGNFTNNNSVRFTNQTNPDYDSRATNGAVSLVFYGAANKTFSCYGTTDLYNLVIDKGTDRTYELQLYADNKAYFTLFGQNNLNWNTTDPANPEMRKALWIKNGTLTLKGNVNIPSLSEGTRDFTIGQNARLKLDGANVFVGNTANGATDWTGLSHPGTPDGIPPGGGNQGLYVLGKLQVDNGHYYLGEAEAINFRDEAPGIIEVNGGLLETNQIAISSSATLGNFSFIINGGEVRITREYGGDDNRAMLNLDTEDMVFSMSGGELYIEDVTGHDPNCIHIASLEGNYNVTGGTVYIDVNANATVRSTAPFYNLQINNGSTLTLQEDLTVLGDLTIESGAALTTAGFDVYIGADFDLQNGGIYTHGGNTTHFIGNGRSNIYVRNTLNPGELLFNNVTLSKDQRYNTSLFHRVEVNSPGRNSDVHPVEIQGNLYIERGEFDVDEWEVDVHGNIEIVDGQIISSETSKPEGWIVLNGSAQQTIKGSDTKEQEFGSFELDNTNGVLLLSDINVNDFTLTQGVMDLDIYNLEVSGTLNTSGTYSSTLMYKTAGNAGDGGISLYVNGTGTYLFPIGTDDNAVTRYTPAWVDVNTFNDDGYIRMSVADDDLPTALSPGGNVLSYYWRVRHSGFATNPTVHFTFLSDESDDPTTGGGDKADISIASAVVGEVLNESPYLRANVDGGVNESNIGGTTVSNDWYFYTNSRTLASASYTVGKNTSFNGTLDVYYTTNNGRANWNTQTKWTKNTDGTDDGNSGYPQAGDVAIIKSYGDNNQNAWVNVNIDIAVGEVKFDHTLGGWSPRMWVTKRDAQLDLGEVSGEGTIFLEVTQADQPAFIGATDLSAFINEPGSVFNFMIDADNQVVPMPSTISVYPNIRIEAGNGGNDDNNRILQTTIPISVKGNVLLDRSSRWRINHDVTIGGDLRITWQRNRTTVELGDDREVTLDIVGNLQLENGDGNDGARLLVKNDNQNSYEHVVRVGGDILFEAGLDVSSSFDLYNGAAPNNNAILELYGTSSGDFVNSTEGGTEIVPDLYRIIMNKGGSGGVTFDFNDAFTLNGPTDGDEKAIELIGGRLGLRDSGIDETLTSGGADFRIPSGCELWLGSSSTVRVSGNNTGIWLDGTLTVGYGVQALLDEGTNNYIQYTSSGNSEIIINGGNSTFHVGSQIRRATTTEEGILNFNLASTTANVVIGTNADQSGEATRGIFELVNTGCNFSQVAGSKISIANGVTNASAPSLFIDLDPSEVSLGNGSIIAFGSTDTEASQNMSIYSSVDLKNIEVNNASTNNPQLTMSTVSLTLDTLTIDALTTFDAIGLDLNLNGDLIANGTFTSNQNNTYFLGTVNQQIVGSPTFWNLYKTTSNQLTLNNDIDVDNELNLDAGTFDDGDNALSVQGSVNMDITATWGGTSDGILMNGNTEQTLTGSGTFGKLSINNSAGISVPQGNEFTIDGALQLENGVLDIGKNLLILNEDAIIIEQNAFSENNMIQTNISFTDAGVKKLFPAIIPADNYDFIYPIGSEGKYTPVELAIDNVNASGSIRVKGANEIHPTITDDTEPCNELDDVLNALKYHWVLEASGISGFNADVSMQYYAEDYQLNSTDYNVTDYIAARLLFGSTLWNKYDETSFDEINNKLRFIFANSDDNGISGDYTAGVEDQTSGCEGAIPDEVPMYISKQNGNWTDASTWETYPDPTGTVPSGGPRGAIAIIKDEVTIPSPYIVSYKTQINSTGLLKVGTTFGHRLGIVEGTGTLQLERGNLPAGVYDDFFSRTGGTIEFTGSDDYDVLSEVNNVRNIIFSGTGERRLPNLDFEVYGEFTMDGSDGNLWVINEHYRNMTLDSSVVFNQGKFDAGVDPSTVIFGGTDQQVISGTGSFTGSNAFNNVIMNNSAGVLLSSPVEIDGTLALNSGIITTDATNVLTVNNDSEIAVSRVNSSTSNYIDGPMRKFIQTNGNFEFPVGDAGRFGEIVVTNATASSSSYWETEYFNANPDMHTPTSLDTSSRETALEMVSGNEYWRVAGPEATSTSDVTIRWDDQSALPAMTDNRATNLHIAQWVAGSPDQWQSVGDVLTNVSVNEGTLKTTSAVTLQEHYFTIASEESAPLSTATFTSNDTSICDDGSSVATLEITFTGVAPWTVTISEGGDSQVLPATSDNPYTFTVDTAGTYTIASFTDGNTNPGVVFGPDVTVTVVALPTAYAMTPVGPVSYCEGTSGVALGLANSELNVNYELFAGVTSVGVWAGTGAALNFGNQTNTATVTYSVVGTSTTGGCTQNMSSTVGVTENLVPEFTPTAAQDTICYGSSSQLNVDIIGPAGYSYSWSPVDSLSAGNIVNPVYTPGGNILSATPITTTFTVTVTNTTTTCSDTGTVDVVVYRLPETGPQYHISNVFGN